MLIENAKKAIADISNVIFHIKDGLVFAVTN